MEGGKEDGATEDDGTGGDPSKGDTKRGRSVQLSVQDSNEGTRFGRTSWALRRSVLAGECRPSEDLLAELDRQDDVSGFFHDFLERAWTSSRGRHKTARLLLDVKFWQEDKFLLNGLASGDVAIETVIREKVYSSIISALQAFGKEGGDVKWATSTDAFAKYARAIVALKKDSRHLDDEARRSSMQQVIHTLVRRQWRDVEAADKRHDRLRTFWPRFHGFSRNADLPTSPSLGSALPLVREIHGKAKDVGATPLRAVDVFSRGSPTGLLSPLSSSSPVGDLMRPQWKERAARSRCSARGGTSGSVGLFGLLASCTASANSSPCAAKGLGLRGSSSLPQLAGLSPEGLGLRGSSSLPQLAGLGSRPRTTQPASRPISAFDGSTATAEELFSCRDDELRFLAPEVYLANEEEDCEAPGGTLGRISRGDWWRIDGKSSSPQSKRPRSGRKELILAHATSSASRGGAFGGTLPGERRLALAPLQKAQQESPKAFAVPWGASSALPFPASPTQQYLQACYSDGLLPQPTPFVTGHSACIAVKDHALLDIDLAAMSQMISLSPGIEEVDLQNNTGLSGEGVVKLLQCLSQGRSSFPLKKLSLQRVPRAGKDRPMNALISFLSSDAAPNLKVLNLSGVPLGMQWHVPLCRAIGEHQSLDAVHLANTDLGKGNSASGTRTQSSKQCITAILSSATIRLLDLGWNCFDEQVFAVLGEELARTNVLQNLAVPGCSSASCGHLRCRDSACECTSPVLAFIEQVPRCKALRRLDLSVNFIDYRGAFVIEEALERGGVSELVVQENPLGVIGMRSMLRLLSSETSALRTLSCDGCSIGPGLSGLAFRQSMPSGDYNFDLSRPFHRAVLRKLYKMCEFFKVQPGEAFTGLQTHAQKDSDGVYSVPTQGNLSTSFALDKFIESRSDSIVDAAEYIDFYQQLIFVKIAPSKMGPVLTLWNSFAGDSAQQEAYVDALSKEFILSYPYVERLCADRSMQKHVIQTLLSRVDGDTTGLFLTMLRIPSLQEYVNVLKRSRNFFAFNIHNPSGHYALNLASPCDYTLAEQLALVDTWETALRKKLHHEDFSQFGNYSQVRNARYASQKMMSLSAFKLPDNDFLEFDYASGRRRPLGTCAVSEDVFENILVAVQSSMWRTEGKAIGLLLEPAVQLQALRLASHHLFLSTFQLRGLLHVFRTEASRVECFVMFANNVVDMENEKVFRVLYSEGALKDIFKRVGCALCFPYIQPDMTFTFDLAHHDERVAACNLITLAKKEGVQLLTITPGEVVKEFPLSWDDVGKIPMEGIFSAKYQVTLDSRDFTMRSELFKKHGGWPSCEEDAKKIKWWASPEHAPISVVHFTECLGRRGTGFSAAFKDLTSGTGTESETLTETQFKAGVLRDLECNIFSAQGPEHESKQLEEVFRWLQQRNSGGLEQRQFEYLELLWREITLTMKECVQFMRRTFSYEPEGDGDLDPQDQVGGTDNIESAFVRRHAADRVELSTYLKTAWNHISKGMEGPAVDKKTFEEFAAASGFFGPARIIFHILDDDKGYIMKRDLKRLEKYGL